MGASAAASAGGGTGGDSLPGCAAPAGHLEGRLALADGGARPGAGALEELALLARPIASRWLAVLTVLLVSSVCRAVLLVSISCRVLTLASVTVAGEVPGAEMTALAS